MHLPHFDPHPAGRDLTLRMGIARGIRLLMAGSVVIATLGDAAWAGAANDVQTVRIVIDGPPAPSVAGKAEVQLRIFEAEDPDAPPNVTAIAIENKTADPLTFPIVMEVAVSKARLAAAMLPAVAVIIVVNGSMAYWTEAIAPLDRSRATEVLVVRVP